MSRRSDGREVGEDYQRLCIRSWLDCGLRVLSINSRSEIGALAKRFPEVEFVAADRDASSISGRANPYLSDLLSVLADSSAAIVGIVNGDVVFEPEESWRTWLPALAANFVVTGHRLDSRTLFTGAVKKYDWGFDYFFFHRDAAARAAEKFLPFAMGLPWWDYWLPMTMMLAGTRTLLLERPAVLHLAHESTAQMAGWHQLGMTLAHRIVEQSENVADPATPIIADILSRCRKLIAAAGPELERGEQDEKLATMAQLCALAARSNVVRLAPTDMRDPPRKSSGTRDDGDPSGSEFIPARAFRGFQERLIAGQALESALRLDSQGRADADVAFRAALERAPNDSEVLFQYGTYLARKNAVPNAITLLRKADGLEPNACRIINALGATLSRLGQDHEAVELYERALELDPGFFLAYYNLGLAAQRLGRGKEPLARLETLLASEARAEEAVETYVKLKRELAKLERAALPQEAYCSRYGEDALLDAFFGFRDTGRYVDIGASDGINFDNSHIFERRGWSGICLRTTKESLTTCRQNRPGGFCAEYPNGSFERLATLVGDKPVDFLCADLSTGSTDASHISNLLRLRPRVALFSADPGMRAALAPESEKGGYLLARSLGDSHFHAADETTRRRLREIPVAAKLSHTRPRRFVNGRFEQSQAVHIYWPAET
jgi:tetratricopeptide (TPR) repeat protein